MWERVLAVYCVFHFSEGLWSMILVDDPYSMDGSPVMRMAWYPIYLFGIFGLLRAGSNALRAILSTPLLYCALALAFASTLWSLDPEVTSRRAFALAMTSLFGVYLAARYKWREMILIVAAGFATMAVVGALGSLTMPSLFVDQTVHVGAWKGVWVEKNVMGGLMVRGFAACACAYLISTRHKSLWAFFTAFCAAMVLLSTSAGALLALLMGATLILAITMLRKGPAQALFFGYSALAIILAAAVIAIFMPGEILQALGRDPSLTGRTPIWTLVMAEIKQHLWVGNGFGVFWKDQHGAANYIRVALQWGVPNAHNGWLDLALNLGFTGVLLCGLYLFLGLWRAASKLFDPVISPFAITMLVLSLQFSMSESVIAQQNNVVWVTFVAICTKLAMGRDAGDLQPVAHPRRRLAAQIAQDRLARGQRINIRRPKSGEGPTKPIF
jgi:exopolysaccharide production protein ExoQ